MEIFLVRHGLAFALGERNIRRDAERPLTPEGRKKTTWAAKALEVLGYHPSLILTSPLVRARQTADILAGQLSLSDKVRETAALTPAAGITGEIGKAGAQSVILTGHNPGFEDLASVLVTGAKGAGIVLKKSSVCRITFETAITPGRGRLEWLLQPEHLKHIVKY